MSLTVQSELDRLPQLETFQLGSFTVPRLWVGLWQLSSTAWGSASAPKVRNAMIRHIEQGFNAFGTPFLTKPSNVLSDQWLDSDMVRGTIKPAEYLLTGFCCVCYASTGWVDPRSTKPGGTHGPDRS